MVGAEGTIHYCNARLAYILRYNIEDLMGRLFQELVVKEFLPSFLSLLKRSVHEGARDELVLKGRSDKLVPVYVSCSPVSLPGELGVGVVITDLTQQKQSLAIRTETTGKTSLDRFAISVAGSVIARYYDKASLKEAVPEAFEKLVARYGELLELSLEQRVLKVNHRVPEHLQGAG